MAEKLIFNCTSGAEDPERATLPFIAANVAASAGQEAIVLCTVEAVPEDALRDIDLWTG